MNSIKSMTSSARILFNFRVFSNFEKKTILLHVFRKQSNKTIILLEHLNRKQLYDYGTVLKTLTLQISILNKIIVNQFLLYPF